MSPQPESRLGAGGGVRASAVGDWWWSFQNRLGRLLASDEVDRDPRLKVICGCLLLYYHMTFQAWRENSVALSTAGNRLFDYAPVAFLENARWLVFMDGFQTETWMFGLGMAALFGLFSLLYFRSSVVALGLLAWLFVNKLYFYFCDFRLFTNYHHFHLSYTLIFLLSRDKLRFVRGALAVGYLVSGVVKLSPSWLLGEYFNSIPGKLPLLPKLDWVVTTASVGVVVLEFLGPLCWLVGPRWLRRLSLVAFVVFHVYSGVIVGYWYTTLMLPLVVAAFTGFEAPLLAGFRFRRRDAAPIAVLVLALLGSAYQFLIPGDVRLTAEGRYLGQFMFDANHAVRFQTRIQKGNKSWAIEINRRQSESGDAVGVDAGIRCDFYQDGWMTNSFTVLHPIRDDGEVIFNPRYFTSARLRIAGDPYLYYFYARELVRRYRPDRLSIRLDEQLDGRPEVATLLDIPDFAALNPTYRSFRHNEWILLPGTGPHPGTP